MHADQQGLRSDPNCIIGYLGLDAWHYGVHFDPQVIGADRAVVDEVEAYVASVALDQHPFFRAAYAHRSTLVLWTTQELVMTNAFSQLVLWAASQIPNVHARAVLAEVAYGEHNKSHAGLAAKSHPWLLDGLRASLGIATSDVHPVAATLGFIERLATHVGADPLTAVAFVGVGNERLIVPEYEAIERCFGHLVPEADFKPFLHANLHEDVIHSRLCYDLALALIATPDDEDRYRAAAFASIDSRVQYFDELLLLVESP